MGIKLGNDYLLWVESATPGTYNAVKGQGTLSETRSAAKIDTSDKTTAGYATQAYGLISLTQSLDLKVNLPDANGYTRLESAANTFPSAPINIQVRKNGAAGVSGDAIFQASVYVTITSRSFDKDGTVVAKMEFGLAAAPTIDAMA